MFIKQNKSKSSVNTTSFVLFTDWSLTVREERRLRVFENRVLRGIFGAKRDEVTGEWRKLHKYCSGDKIEKNGMGGAYSPYGGGERCIQDFGGET